MGAVGMAMPVTFCRDNDKQKDDFQMILLKKSLEICCAGNGDYYLYSNMMDVIVII